MKRYEEYQNVDQKWVKDIPVHWDFFRIKRIFAQRVEKNDPVITDNILSLTAKQGVVPHGEKEGNGGNKPKGDMTQYNIARPNDLLVNCMNIVAGSAGVSRYFGAISPVYYALYPRLDCNIWYYHYLFRLVTFQRSLLGLGKGILMHESETGKLNTVRMRISMDYLGNVGLPVPPRAEQDQIVRYLDWQMSKINRLIAAKRKQIALLREQIQQTITDAVYYGVDQTVNYQPVKMLYVDKIPAHWECKRGKYLLAEHDIRSMDGKEELLSVSHITGVTPRSQKNITMFKAESLVNYKICRKNDIAANTMWMWQGAIAVSSYHGVISPSYNTYHQIDNAYDPVYLDYMLRSMPLVDEYCVRSTGIRKSRLRLYPEQLLDMFFPVPPKDEQKLIAAVITEKTQVANDFIAAIEKQIEQINELRVRMISDVVTGQVDVRGIEVPEYEFVEDLADEQEDEQEGETYEE